MKNPGGFSSFGAVEEANFLHQSYDKSRRLYSIPRELQILENNVYTT